LAAALNTLVKDVVANVFANKFLPSMEVSRDGTYKKVTLGAFTPSTGAVSSTEESVSVKIIKRSHRVDSASGSANNSTGIASERIGGQSKTFLEFLVQPISGVLPEQGGDDIIVVGSETFNVHEVNSIDLGPDSLLYKITAIGG
jgi:hypothetical protein